MDRRQFFKDMLATSVAAGVSASGFGLLSASEPGLFRKKPHYDSKGLPTVALGKDGVVIPRMILGLGSRFCNIDDEEEAIEMLNFALDNGFYYWDTAHAYDNTIARPAGRPKPPRLVYSEVRLGEVLKYRRKEVFLSTKVTAREPSKALAEIEDSLNRLQTDHLETLKIHSVNSMEDVEEMSKPGHLIDIVHRMREEGICKYIGFSCHADAYAAKAMCDRGDFDSMLIAMNQWDSSHLSPRQQVAVPAAKANGLAVFLMKLVRPKENRKDINIPDLIRYALSLDGPDAVCLGMDSIEVVKSNIEILKNFRKFSAKEMQELSEKLGPFYV